MFLAWWAFTATFLFLRLLTWGLHFRDNGQTTKGGIHLHHFLRGIILVSVIAAIGLTDHAEKWRSWIGVGFGIGLALIVDEISLLVALKDVYWSGTGAGSVGAAIILIAIGGSLLVLTRSPPNDPD